MFLFICLTVHFACSMGYQPCWNAIPSREIPKNMPTHQTPWNMFFISFMFIRLRDYHDYAVFSPEPSLYPHQCNQHQDFLCPTKSGDSFTEPKWVEHLPLPFPLELPCDPASKPGCTVCTDMNWRYTLTITWRHCYLAICPNKRFHHQHFLCNVLGLKLITRHWHSDTCKGWINLNDKSLGQPEDSQLHASKLLDKYFFACLNRECKSFQRSAQRISNTVGHNGVNQWT